MRQHRFRLPAGNHDFHPQNRLLYAVDMTARTAFLLASALLLSAQKPLPRFEDWPAPTDWKGPAAVPKLTNRDERMFRTRLLQASHEPANFAGRYRITYWGCGSECAAAAVIDLETGNVFPPPLAKANGSGWEHWITCPASFEGTGDEFRPDSRLMIVRCGLNFDEQLQRNCPTFTTSCSKTSGSGNSLTFTVRLPRSP